jgi:ribosomal protein S18 acetylase RimI-like enzyme
VNPGRAYFPQQPSLLPEFELDWMARSGFFIKCYALRVTLRAGENLEATMLTLELAKTECQIDQLLELVYSQDMPGLRPTMDLIQLNWEQFGKVFRERGMAFRALRDGTLVGGCWVELCGDVLNIHGLMVKAPYRRQGIGTWILHTLQKIFEGRVQMIELVVHRSKPAAIALYEKFGFELAEAMAQTGFYRMQKWLQPAGHPQVAADVSRLPQSANR